MAVQEQFCEQCGMANAADARFCQFCAAPLTFKHVTGSLAEQTLLSERYQLVSLIGQGGMGAVYKAVDTRFNNRPIAIKEMSRSGLTPARIQEAEESFEREARLLADLLHPNLPRIYDHFTQGERSYLVMDFIEGRSLEEFLESANGKPLPLDQVLDWGMQLCDVLSYLHTHHPPIIFRDLKPSNVMVSESGHIFLIDFGIARVFKPGQSHDTVALGSPGFAAPEQYGKSQSTPRSDIYSLGALLHSLLTGVDPSEQPFFFRPASQINPQVPPDLDILLQQMVEMNAEKRPASAQEVLKVLRMVDQQRISGTFSQTLPSYTSSPVSAGANGPQVATGSARTRQLLQEAYRLYSQRRLKEALTTYDLAIQSDNTSALAWQGRGLTQALSGHHREALYSFDQALKYDPRLVTALNGKGTALNILHRNQEALQVFEQALQREPDNADAWNGKGAVLSALGRPEEALEAFKFALHFNPRMAQAYSNRGLVLRQQKRYTEALRAFEQALSYEPDSVVYLNGRGLVLYEMGRYRDAHIAYQEALKRNPQYVPSLYGIGNVFYMQQRLKKAYEYYNQAINADPNFVKAWDRLGNVLSDMERYNEALDAYERSLRFNSNVPLTWNGKGNTLYQLGNYQEALDAYNHALRLKPNMVSALHNKSLVLRQLRRYDEALQAAEDAISLAPNDPDNWQRKAEALKKLGRRREARAAEAEMMRLRQGA